MGVWDYEKRGNEEWWRLHNEEPFDLYFSSSIFRMSKSRRMRWTGHVAPMGGRRGASRVLIGKPQRKRP